MVVLAESAEGVALVEHEELTELDELRILAAIIVEVFDNGGILPDGVHDAVAGSGFAVAATNTAALSHDEVVADEVGVDGVGEFGAEEVQGLLERAELSAECPVVGAEDEKVGEELHVALDAAVPLGKILPAEPVVDVVEAGVEEVTEQTIETGEFRPTDDDHVLVAAVLDGFENSGEKSATDVGLEDVDTADRPALELPADGEFGVGGDEGLVVGVTPMFDHGVAIVAENTAHDVGVADLDIRLTGAFVGAADIVEVGGEEGAGVGGVVGVAGSDVVKFEVQKP